MNNIEKITKPANSYAVFRKTIGETTYIVNVHFSETTKETLGDKIKRILSEEVRKL